MLNSRELSHRIRIERKANKQDPVSGEINSGWSLVADKVPAKVSPLSVREFIASQALQSAIVARITIRYRSGLTADMRVVHRDKIYNPQGWLADEDSGLSYLTAPCTEGVNEG